MPLQDTGLDFYESSMRPVRAGIQSIITRADQNRKELESQRLQIAAEERAEARGIEREKRGEALTVRMEERHAATKEEEDRELAITIANSYGVATHEPDGSPSSTKEIQERNKRAEDVRPHRQTLLANMRWLEQIPSIPKYIIEQIKNEDFGLSPERLEAIWLTHKDTVTMLRKGGLEKLRKGTPLYTQQLEEAKFALKTINKKLGDIQGNEIIEAAQEVVDNFNNPDQTGRTPDQYWRKAGTHAAGDDRATMVTQRADLGPGLLKKIELNGVTVAIHKPDGTINLTTEQIEAAKNRYPWFSMVDLTSPGTARVPGIVWALQNKPAEMITGDWPIGVTGPNDSHGRDEGIIMSLYDKNVSDPERAMLQSAFQRGMEFASEEAVAAGEYGYWAAELQVKVQTLKFKPYEKELDVLHRQREAFLKDFPELWRYNSITNTMGPEPTPPKDEPTPVPEPEPTATTVPDLPLTEGGALSDLAGATTAPAPAAVTPAEWPVVDDTVLAEPLNADGLPWDPSNVALPREEDELQARLDNMSLEEFIEQAKGPPLYNEDTGELLPLDADGNPVVPEYAPEAAVRGEPGFEPFGLPSDRGPSVQGNGYYDLDGNWVYSPVGRGQYEPPPRKEAVAQSPPPVPSPEAQEGLRRMREALYTNRDYDPRLPAAENAIRGQMGQAPPSLGQSPSTLLPRRPAAVVPAPAPGRPKSYGELREAQRQQQSEARANNMAAINADTIPRSGGGWGQTSKARLYHLYNNPLYGRGKKGGQRLMELAAQSRR